MYLTTYPHHSMIYKLENMLIKYRHYTWCGGCPPFVHCHNQDWLTPQHSHTVECIRLHSYLLKISSNITRYVIFYDTHDTPDIDCFLMICCSGLVYIWFCEIVLWPWLYLTSVVNVKQNIMTDLNCMSPHYIVGMRDLLVAEGSSDPRWSDQSRVNKCLSRTDCWHISEHLRFTNST